MIAAFVKANVKPGKKDQLLEFLRWDVQVARDEEPKTLRFDVFEDINDDSIVYFYEAYTDESGFEEHKQGAPFKAFVDGVMAECIESLEPLMPAKSLAYCTTAE